MDDLRDTFNHYRDHLSKEIDETKVKHDDLIDRVQALINSNGDQLKMDLKKETKDFVKILMKALYFKERQQDFFSSQQAFISKHNFSYVDILTQL